jgi:hypothetical protein
VINLLWHRYITEQPITGIDKRHLDTVVDYLRKYHEDTGGLPSAVDYLDLVRCAVENTALHTTAV